MAETNVMYEEKAVETAEMPFEETVKTEAVETPEKVIEKLYTFRELQSSDVFPMFRIISKIGLKEFTAAIDKDVLSDLINGFKDGNTEESFAVSGASVILGIADVIFSKLPNCENDIYQLLSQASNLTFEEVKTLNFVTFTEMVIDFIKKDDFKDFIKVVSGLFK